MRRYLRAGSGDSLLAGDVRASVLDSFKPYLHDRLAHGVRNATMLNVEIAEQATPAATPPWPATYGRCVASTRPRSRRLAYGQSLTVGPTRLDQDHQ